MTYNSHAVVPSQLVQYHQHHAPSTYNCVHALACGNECATRCCANQHSTWTNVSVNHEIAWTRNACIQHGNKYRRWWIYNNVHQKTCSNLSNSLNHNDSHSTGTRMRASRGILVIRFCAEQINSALWSCELNVVLKTFTRYSWRFSKWKDSASFMPLRRTRFQIKLPSGVP